MLSGIGLASVSFLTPFSPRMGGLRSVRQKAQRRSPRTGKDDSPAAKDGNVVGSNGRARCHVGPSPCEIRPGFATATELYLDAFRRGRNFRQFVRGKDGQLVFPAERFRATAPKVVVERDC